MSTGSPWNRRHTEGLVSTGRPALEYLAWQTLERSAMEDGSQLAHYDRLWGGQLWKKEHSSPTYQLWKI